MVEESTMRDINDIPNGWVTSPLKSISIYKNGKAHESFIDQSGEYIVVNSKFISTEGDIVKYSKVALSPANADSILMVMSDVPNGKAIAKCFHVPKGKYQFTVNQRVCEIISKIDSKFLYYILNRNPYFLSFDDGAKQTNLRREEVENCPIKFPLNKEEQIAISTTLTDIDTLITSLQKLIDKKKLIQLGVKQNLLTARKRLPGFNGDWKSYKLSQIFKLSAAKSKSQFIVTSGKYLVMDMGGVSAEGQIITNKTTNYAEDILSKGDLVMPKDDIGGGNIIGKVAYIDKNYSYVLGDHVYKLSLVDNNIVPSFIAFLLNSFQINTELKKKVAGSAQLGLSRKAVEEQIITVPIDKTEQKAIANIISDFDKDIIILESKLSKLQLIKQGSMQQLLTGKIRLI